MKTKSIVTGLLLLVGWASRPVFSATDLDAGFREPPTEYHPRVWWDWLNGNINKDRIPADLEDMKRVGIGGLQLRDINPKFPDGPVRDFSDEWYACLHLAIKTCADLGLEFGMHNTPGWSSSGGPFVKVDDSMKKIVWTELPPAEGKVHAKLAQPLTNFDFYRDIAVLAVPADEDDGIKPILQSDYKDADVNLLADGKLDAAGAITFPKKYEGDIQVTFTYPKAVQRRLLTINTVFQRAGKVSINGTVEASEDGKTFKEIRKLAMSGNHQAHEGFIGTDPVLTVPFEPVTATSFRVTLKGPIATPLAELTLSDHYRIENYETKIISSVIGSLIPPPDASTKDSAAILPDKVIDLTASMSPDGTLDWQAPPGRWVVLRFGYTTTGIPNHPVQPEGRGFEVDKMDANAVTRCFNNSLGRVLKENEAYIGKTFTSVFSDSWEAAQQNWCADFGKEFASRRGYDIKIFLPVVTGRVVGSEMESEAFLIDFRRTIADLIAEHYHGTMSTLAKSHGLRYYSEAYGGKAFSESRSATLSDANMAEFWFYRDRSHLSTAGVKRVAALAHALGRSLIAGESFTTVAQEASFQASPYLLKAVGDMALASGLTQIYFHSYAHQPFDAPPGLSMGSTGTSVGRLTTWWPKAGAFIDYLARCQFMLRQGQPVSDVLELKMPEIGSFVTERYPTMPPGLDYDLADPDYITRGHAENGRLVLPSGASYRVLVLPNIWWGDMAFLEQLEAFTKAGVALVGPPPYCPGGRSDLLKADAFQALVKRLWPAGAMTSVKATQAFEKTLKAKSIDPDCRLDGLADDKQGDYLHRRTNDADIYFICTRADVPVTITADFRIAGRQPELWDAVAGTIAPISVFQTDGKRTTVQITLPDSGSAFIVFRRSLPSRWITALNLPDGKPATLWADFDATADGGIALKSAGPFTGKMNDGSAITLGTTAPAAATPLDGAWAVSFQAYRGPAIKKDYPQLKSWTESDDEAIKYFSGTATYTKQFTVAPVAGQRLVLDLGKVDDLANIRINGKPVATLWTPPFIVDVTSFVQAGTNTLEVDVTNRWVNRLMGDAKYPQDATYQNKPSKGPSWGIIESMPNWLKDPAKILARQRSTFVSYSTNYKPDDELPSSGLLGPVVLRPQTVAEVK